MAPATAAEATTPMEAAKEPATGTEEREEGVTEAERAVAARVAEAVEAAVEEAAAKDAASKEAVRVVVTEG